LAVCGGRGGHLLSAAREAGAEALVTGDVDHHQALEARALGLALIDAGHYHTERPVVERLARFLREEARRREMKVEVYESAVDTGPWSYGGGDERAG
jgi:putative NIF3 family GTP cyclohydrolase 1 type 2